MFTSNGIMMIIIIALLAIYAVSSIISARNNKRAINTVLHRLQQKNN